MLHEFWVTSITEHETLNTSIVDIIDRVTEVEIHKIRANCKITEA